MGLPRTKDPSRFMRPFSSFISNLFDEEGLFDGNFFRSTVVPAVNVKETEEHYEIEVAVPGMEKEDFTVEVGNGLLKISGERTDKEEAENDTYTRKEFGYTAFSRSFTLPDTGKKRTC